MKKIITLLFLCTAIHSNIFSQRMINFGIKLIHPEDNSQVLCMMPFMFDIQIKNAGPETLKATDSIALYVIIDGDTLSFFNGSTMLNYTTFTNTQIAPGDSATISKAFAFDTSFNGMQIDMCVFAIPLNQSNDSVKDNALQNNTNCATVTVVDQLTGIEGLGSDREFMKMYPNPANSFVNFEIRTRSAQSCFVYLMDMTGKQVLYKTTDIHTKGSSIISLNTTDLANGIYIYKVKAGKKEYTGKLSIQK